MSTRETFDWKLDEEFVLSNGAKLRVLKRDVAELEVLRRDLEPFTGSPALWEYRADPTAGTKRVQGNLREYSRVNEVDYFTIEVVGRKAALDLVIGDVRDRELTVWRFADQLDMLQLRVAGASADLYGQIGGEHTLRTFAERDRRSPEDAALRAAMRVFRPGRRTE